MRLHSARELKFEVAEAMTSQRSMVRQVRIVKSAPTRDPINVPAPGGLSNP